MVLAFPSVVLICMSDPLVMSTSIHKYVKYVTYPVFLSNFQAIGYGKVFVLSTLIFLELILNPVSYANLSHCLLQHFFLHLLVVVRTMSSAKSRSLSCENSADSSVSIYDDLIRDLFN